MKTNKVQQVGSVANQIASNIDNPQDYRVYSPGVVANFMYCTGWRSNAICGSGGEN